MSEVKTFALLAPTLEDLLLLGPAGIKPYQFS
jgi:hypothetical protein